MSVFQIHPQLLIDCHRLGRFDLCHVLLHRNASIPWLILVPECSTGDLFDLSEEMRNQAMGEAARITGFIKDYFTCGKINFAAIGNIVPQLHLHVVGRKPDDPCWPAPVWGAALPMQAYSAHALSEITKRLQRRCGLVATIDGDNF